MAGHSKWANIKHRKGRQDAKRGKIFTKLIRELTVAAKHGGPIPADNPRLRLAVDKALTNNMSRDVIDRAIARVPVTTKPTMWSSSATRVTHRVAWRSSSK